MIREREGMRRRPLGLLCLEMFGITKLEEEAVCLLSSKWWS